MYPPGVWFADVMPFSGVTCVLFCFVFVFFLSPKPRPFVQPSFALRYAYAPTATRSYLLTVSVLCFSSFFSVSCLEMSPYQGILVPLPLSLCMESKTNIHYSYPDMYEPPQPHAVTYNNCLRPFLYLFLPFFCFLFGDVAFSEYFCTIAVVSLYGEYVIPVRLFPSDGVFLPCDHGLDLDLDIISYITFHARIQSIK